MVLDHVPQRAGFFVIPAAPLDAETLGNRDLDIIDVVAIPDRLEHAVAEAKDKNVLDRFFAEVVIDAIDLIFVVDPVQHLVQLARALQIASERLFDRPRGSRPLTRPRPALASDQDPRRRDLG